MADKNNKITNINRFSIPASILIALVFDDKLGCVNEFMNPSNGSIKTIGNRVSI